MKFWYFSDQLVSDMPVGFSFKGSGEAIDALD